MLPTFIILKITECLPVIDQLKIFKMSKSLYYKSTDIRNQYKKWWNMYTNNEYSFDNIKFVHYIIDRGFNNWEDGLYYMCKNGNLEGIKLMINKGATNWNSGLIAAYLSSNMKCVQLMISMGATDRNLGLFIACKYNNIEYAELMSIMGATNFNHGLFIACKNKNMQCLQLMINMGATKCEWCNKSINMHIKN